MRDNPGGGKILQRVSHAMQEKFSFRFIPLIGRRSREGCDRGSKDGTVYSG